jgi:hypothetical protein
MTQAFERTTNEELAVYVRDATLRVWSPRTANSGVG